MLVIALSGCSTLTEYTESEQVLLISAVGIDKAANGYTLTAEIVTEGNQQTLLSVTADSIDSLIPNLKKKAGIPLLLSHCGTVFISQDFNISDLNFLLQHLCSLYEFPLSSRLAVTNNCATLLNAKGLSSEPKGYAVLSILQNAKIDSRLFIIGRAHANTLPFFIATNDYYLLKDSLWIIE